MLDNNDSKIYYVRHGQSLYTEEGKDLTPDGIRQIVHTADELNDQISELDEVVFISSPLARTRGSAEVFLERLKRTDRIRIAPSVREVKIIDTEAFREYDRENATPIYGQMYFNDPVIAKGTDFIEGADSTTQRAYLSLERYVDHVRCVTETTGKRVGIVVFTHNEIATNYLRPLSSKDAIFPSEKVPVLKNGEAIAISVGNNTDGFVVNARGLSVPAHLENKDGVRNIVAES